MSDKNQIVEINFAMLIKPKIIKERTIHFVFQMFMDEKMGEIYLNHEKKFRLPIQDPIFYCLMHF